MIECLKGNVLWDTDFEAQDRLDVDPDTSRGLNMFMGISDDYYTAVAHDPPDNQLNLYLDALKGLTPRGRGEARQDDNKVRRITGRFETRSVQDIMYLMT